MLLDLVADQSTARSAYQRAYHGMTDAFTYQSATACSQAGANPRVGASGNSDQYERRKHEYRQRFQDHK